MDFSTFSVYSTKTFSKRCIRNYRSLRIDKVYGVTVREAESRLV